MSELKTSSNVPNQPQNDNQFLPSEHESYHSMTLKHQQRRSMILADQPFPNQNSQPTPEHTPSASHFEPNLNSSFGPIQEHKESKDQEDIENQDEENQFMINQSGHVVPVNHDSKGGPSILSNNSLHSDNFFVNKDGSNSEVFGEQSNIQQQSKQKDEEDVGLLLQGSSGNIQGELAPASDIDKCQIPSASNHIQEQSAAYLESNNEGNIPAPEQSNEEKNQFLENHHHLSSQPQGDEENRSKSNSIINQISVEHQSYSHYPSAIESKAERVSVEPVLMLQQPSSLRQNSNSMMELDSKSYNQDKQKDPVINVQYLGMNQPQDLQILDHLSEQVDNRPFSDIVQQPNLSDPVLQANQPNISSNLGPSRQESDVSQYNPPQPQQNQNNFLNLNQYHKPGFRIIESQVEDGSKKSQAANISDQSFIIDQQIIQEQNNDPILESVALNKKQNCMVESAVIPLEKQSEAKGLTDSFIVDKEDEEKEEQKDEPAPLEKADPKKIILESEVKRKSAKSKKQQQLLFTPKADEEQWNSFPKKEQNMMLSKNESQFLEQIMMNQSAHKSRQSMMNGSLSSSKKEEQNMKLSKHQSEFLEDLMMNESMKKSRKSNMKESMMKQSMKSSKKEEQAMKLSKHQSQFLEDMMMKESMKKGSSRLSKGSSRLSKGSEPAQNKEQQQFKISQHGSAFLEEIKMSESVKRDQKKKRIIRKPTRQIQSELKSIKQSKLQNKDKDDKNDGNYEENESDSLYTPGDSRVNENNFNDELKQRKASVQDIRELRQKSNIEELQSNVQSNAHQEQKESQVDKSRYDHELGQNSFEKKPSKIKEQNSKLSSEQEDLSKLANNFLINEDSNIDPSELKRKSKLQKKSQILDQLEESDPIAEKQHQFIEVQHGFAEEQKNQGSQNSSEPKQEEFSQEQLIQKQEQRQQKSQESRRPKQISIQVQKQEEVYDNSLKNSQARKSKSNFTNPVNISSKKQDLQTGNFLISNQEEIIKKEEESFHSNNVEQYKEPEPQPEIEPEPESEHEPELESQNRYTQLEQKLNISQQKQEKIFNTFPVKPEEFVIQDTQTVEKQSEIEFESPSKKPQIRTQSGKYLTGSPIGTAKAEYRSRKKMISYNQKQINTQKKRQKLHTKHDQNEDHIEKIKALKEAHKKRLERELQKVEKELEDINHKEKKMEKVYGDLQKIEHEEKPVRQPSVHQARRRRESQQIMKMLKEHRRFKEQEVLQFQDLDNNINTNIVELNKMRQEAEERKKQQKRQQILERMKKNELRKMNEQKMARANNQYIKQIKNDSEAQMKPLPISPRTNNRKATEQTVNLIQNNRESRQQLIKMHGSPKQLKSRQISTKIPKIKSISKKNEDRYDYKLD